MRRWSAISPVCNRNKTPLKEPPAHTDAGRTTSAHADLCELLLLHVDLPHPVPCVEMQGVDQHGVPNTHIWRVLLNRESTTHFRTAIETKGAGLFES